MKDPLVFSTEELKSVVFVEKDFLRKKIQKIEDAFGNLTAKLTERKVV